MNDVCSFFDLKYSDVSVLQAHGLVLLRCDFVGGCFPLYGGRDFVI